MPKTTLENQPKPPQHQTTVTVTYCKTLRRYAIHLESATIYLSKEDGEHLAYSLSSTCKGGDA